MSGSKPTKNQSIFITETTKPPLDPRDWVVNKDTPTFMEIQSRITGDIVTLSKPKGQPDG